MSPDQFHVPPDADLTGYRRCSHQRCGHLIPPESQYRYRTCGPCRAQGRRRWWRRKGLKPPDEDAFLRKSESESIMERAMANAVRTAAKEEGPATGKRKWQAVDVDDAQEEGAGGEKLMEMVCIYCFCTCLSLILDAVAASIPALRRSLRLHALPFRPVQSRSGALCPAQGAHGHG